MDVEPAFGTPYEPQLAPPLWPSSRPLLRAAHTLFGASSHREGDAPHRRRPPFPVQWMAPGSLVGPCPEAACRCRVIVVPGVAYDGVGKEVAFASDPKSGSEPFESGATGSGTDSTLTQLERRGEPCNFTMAVTPSHVTAMALGAILVTDTHPGVARALQGMGFTEGVHFVTVAASAGPTPAADLKLESETAEVGLEEALLQVISMALRVTGYCLCCNLSQAMVGCVSQLNRCCWALYTTRTRSPKH